MTTEVDDNRHKVRLQGRTLESTVRDCHAVTVEDGEDGMLVAKCPELGVVTQGVNMDDVQRNVVEAVELAREEQGKGGEFSVDVRRRI